jgi:lauroyl/myristoyl acyltransferase
MLDRLTYWLALGAITVIRHLPLAVCFLLGQVLGAALWAILPRYRKLARENLSAAFADLTGAQLRSLTFRHFITLGANGVCAFKIAALPPKPSRALPVETSDCPKTSSMGEEWSGDRDMGNLRTLRPDCIQSPAPN